MENSGSMCFMETWSTNQKKKFATMMKDEIDFETID